MDFTQEQLDYITKLVEAKVKKATTYTKKKTLCPRSEYHTFKEIREIILANKELLKIELNYEPFKLQTIVHCVRKFVTLRSADQDLIGNGMLRFDYQVSRAITTWNASPFGQVVGHPRHLCWKQS